MHHFGFLNSKSALPEPSSPEMAALGLERWLEAAAETAENGGAGPELADLARATDSDLLGKRFLQSVEVWSMTYVDRVPVLLGYWPLTYVYWVEFKDAGPVEWIEVDDPAIEMLRQSNIPEIVVQ